MAGLVGAVIAAIAAVSLGRANGSRRMLAVRSMSVSAMAVHGQGLGQDLVQPRPDPADAAAQPRRRYLLLGGSAGSGRQGRPLGHGQLGPFLIVERPGPLDERTARQLDDDAGLHAVLNQVQDLALQAEADPL